MQNLRAEISQLGGLGERNRFHAMSAPKNRGVGRQHAVDIGPDLDLFGADARPHDGRGVIGAPAAERGSDAIPGRADESAHDHDLCLRQGRNRFSQPGVSFGEEGSGLGVSVIGHDDAAGVDMCGVHSEMTERE